MSAGRPAGDPSCALASRLLCLPRTLSRVYFLPPQSFHFSTFISSLCFQIFMESFVLNNPSLCSATSPNCHQIPSYFISQSKVLNREGFRLPHFPSSETAFLTTGAFLPFACKGFSVFGPSLFVLTSLVDFRLDSCFHLETKPLTPLPKYFSSSAAFPSPMFNFSWPLRSALTPRYFSPGSAL